TSMINFGAYNHWFGSTEYDDIRGMSLFSSHVRYALLVVMSVAIMIHFLFKKQGPTLLWIVLLVWFNYYTYFSQILSGAITLLGIYAVVLFYWVWHKKKIIALIGLFSVLITATVIIVMIFKPITYDPVDFTYKTLDRRTAEGNKYYHKAGIVSPETGKPIHIYISYVELKREWEKVSKIPFDGLDVKGQHISSTIIRYMASKDLRKDAVGFAKLTKKDIKCIENGCTTVHNKGMIARIYGLQYQLSNVTDPNGHSLLQRVEYWRTGTQIAKRNWLIGVGTGDAQLAFNHQYYRDKSVLTKENRDRSHNMYLTLLLTIGIVGLVLLLWSHIRYFALNFKSGQIVAVLFITIALLSYFMEDTLETQTGVTFFALFYGLFFNFVEKEQIS
ncbi:MAG: O-antigen ligase family protein, partial [Crocinitomicaceae bacterium]|nr:O-antigen ligase family protein [Crocinitomicaceae bacterium]